MKFVFVRKMEYGIAFREVGEAKCRDLQINNNSKWKIYEIDSA
jgi:hypothetical protein